MSLSATVDAIRFFTRACFTSCPSRPTAQPILACMGLGGHRGSAFSQTQCHSIGVDEGGAAIHLSCQSEAQEKRYKVFLNLSFPGQHPPTPPPEDPLYLFFYLAERKVRTCFGRLPSSSTTLGDGRCLHIFFLPPPCNPLIFICRIWCGSEQGKGPRSVLCVKS